MEQSGTEGTVGRAEIISSFKNFNPHHIHLNKYRDVSQIILNEEQEDCEMSPIPPEEQKPSLLSQVQGLNDVYKAIQCNTMVTSPTGF